MNQLDLYLESLQEGKIWDATKKVWKNHKGKILAGATGLAAAGAIAYKAKNSYDKSHTPEAIHAKNMKDVIDKRKAAADKDRRITNKRDSDETKENIKAGVHTAKKTAEIVVDKTTKPIRYVGGKLMGLTGRGIKSGYNATKRSLSDTVKNIRDGI